ncbi:MAG: hypothetical protein ACXABY_18000 [Candidatus Thorarchaeota archaeon]|jgi:hypothetical protein
MPVDEYMRRNGRNMWSTLLHYPYERKKWRSWSAHDEPPFSDWPLVQGERMVFGSTNIKTRGGEA